MERQEFSGRTAAEAAIKACDEFGISRSQLNFEVISDQGEGMERQVKITATTTGATGGGREAPPVQQQKMRSEKPKREGRGGERGTGSRNGGRGGRGGRTRHERGSRRRPSGLQQDPGSGIEALLNLETVPSTRGPERVDLEGDLSSKAVTAKEILIEMFKLTELRLVVHIVQDDEEEIHLDLRGADEAKIIGQRGEVLLALQFILNRLVGRKDDGEQMVVLDAANYRVRRRQALAELATKLSERAMEEGKVVRLSLMSAHDRRIFHVTLKEISGVSTRSEGDGLYRNLLIIPVEFE